MKWRSFQINRKSFPSCKHFLFKQIGWQDLNKSDNVHPEYSILVPIPYFHPIENSTFRRVREVSEEWSLKIRYGLETVNKWLGERVSLQNLIEAHQLSEHSFRLSKDVENSINNGCAQKHKQHSFPTISTLQFQSNNSFLRGRTK